MYTFVHVLYYAYVASLYKIFNCMQLPLVELVYYSSTPKGLSIQRLLSFSYLKLIHPEVKMHTVILMYSTLFANLCIFIYIFILCEKHITFNIFCFQNNAIICTHLYMYYTMLEYIYKYTYLHCFMINDAEFSEFSSIFYLLFQQVTYGTFHNLRIYIRKILIFVLNYVIRIIKEYLTKFANNVEYIRMTVCIFTSGWITNAVNLQMIVT
jgi:hypothetical protein